MDHKYLIVVDMQNDFITGSLGTAEAQKIVPGVVRKISGYKGRVLFTQDTHGEDYLATQEGQKLPVRHCIAGTIGWELEKRVEELQRERGCPVYQKAAFGSWQLAQDLQKWNQEQPISEIELIGLCTDVCVISNALLLKAYLPEVPIWVDASLCAGITPAKHDAALEVMQSCHVGIRGTGEARSCQKDV